MDSLIEATTNLKMIPASHHIPTDEESWNQSKKQRAKAVLARYEQIKKDGLDKSKQDDPGLEFNKTESKSLLKNKFPVNEQFKWKIFFSKLLDLE